MIKGPKDSEVGELDEEEKGLHGEERAGKKRLGIQK